LAARFSAIAHQRRLFPQLSPDASLMGAIEMPWCLPQIRLQNRGFPLSAYLQEPSMQSLHCIAPTAHRKVEDTASPGYDRKFPYLYLFGRRPAFSIALTDFDDEEIV
jgi:hypothetical protein